MPILAIPILDQNQTQPPSTPTPTKTQALASYIMIRQDERSWSKPFKIDLSVLNDKKSFLDKLEHGRLTTMIKIQRHKHLTTFNELVLLPPVIIKNCLPLPLKLDFFTKTRDSTRVSKKFNKSKNKKFLSKI